MTEIIISSFCGKFIADPPLPGLQLAGLFNITLNISLSLQSEIVLLVNPRTSWVSTTLFLKVFLSCLIKNLFCPSSPTLTIWAGSSQISGDKPTYNDGMCKSEDVRVRMKFSDDLLYGFVRLHLSRIKIKAMFAHSKNILGQFCLVLLALVQQLNWKYWYLRMKFAHPRLLRKTRLKRVSILIRHVTEREKYFRNINAPLMFIINRNEESYRLACQAKFCGVIPRAQQVQII